MKTMLLGMSLAASIFLVGSYWDVYPKKHYTHKAQLNTATYRLKYWSDWVLKRSPEYVWGGMSLEKPVTAGRDKGKIGLDCSGLMYWLMRKSGLGHFRRTTSRKMWSTWPGVRYEWDEYKDFILKNVRFPYIVFFTFSKDRFAGHTGMFRNERIDPNEQLVFIEASSSKKRTKVTPFNTYRQKRTVGILIPKLVPTHSDRRW